MFSRTSEKILTLFGIFVGSFIGNTLAYHAGGPAVSSKVSLTLAFIFAVVLGLVFNKIGSEADRKRFLEENEITPIPQRKFASELRTMSGEEYRKLTFREKLNIWINEAEEKESCENTQKK